MVGKRSKEARVVKLFMECRDAWHEAEPDAKARDVGLPGLAQWVVSTFKKGVDIPEAVEELLKAVCGEGGPEYYNEDQLVEKLKENVRVRNYRIVMSVDLVEGEDDYRAREALVHAMEEGLLTPSNKAVRCHFFSAARVGKGTKYKSNIGKGKGEEVFATPTLATVFEKVVFLSTLASLGQKISKRKLGPVTHLEANQGQRVGFVIHKVVSAWDMFAVQHGFESVEELVLPYVSVEPKTFSLRVLKREEGFVPKEHAKRLFTGKSATLVGEETFLEAYRNKPALDAHIRKLAELFLRDIRNGTHAIGLLQETFDSGALRTLGKYDVPASFRTMAEALPKRFKCRGEDGEVIQSVSLARKISEEEFLEKEQQGVIRSNVEGETDSEKERKESLKRWEQAQIVKAALKETKRVFRAPKPALGGYSEEVVEEARECVRQESRRFLRMHNCTFQDLLEVDDMEPNMESIQGGAQLILTDPPYNTRREQGRENSAYDSLSEEQMEQFVDIVHETLRAGGHGIVFCSAQQFPVWEKAFSEHEAVSELGRRKRPAFLVDRVPLIMVDTVDGFRCIPSGSCKLRSSAEFALHVKKNGLSYEEEKQMVNYKQFGHVGSEFAGYKNVINNVPRLKPGEQLRFRDRNGKRRALRNEQKCLPLLKELICRFSQPGDVVVDSFSGSFATALACVSLSQHRRFVGCELDEECFEVARKHVLTRFAQAVVAVETDIKLSVAGRRAAKVVASGFTLRSRTPSSSEPDEEGRGWRSPVGLPQYQRFPAHLLAHMASSWGQPDFLTQYSLSPPQDWPVGFREELQMLNVNFLRNIDATGVGVLVAKSKIKNRHAGLGLFAAKPFQAGEVVGNYFGTLLYHSLEKRENLTKMYGEGILGVNTKRFSSHAFQIIVDAALTKDVCGTYDGNPSVFVVPPEFCAAGYINDYKYAAGDEETEEERSYARHPNVGFVQRHNPVTHESQLVETGLIYVKALRDIQLGEELYANYGKENVVPVQQVGKKRSKEEEKQKVNERQRKEERNGAGEKPKRRKQNLAD